VNKSPRGYLVKDLVAGQNYPISQSFGNFGPFAGFAGGHISEYGDIYFSAHSSSSVLKLNRNSRTTSLIGFLGNSAQKHAKFNRSPQGNLYAPPFNAVSNANILKVDPLTDTVTAFDNTSSGIRRYYGFVLANNGMMYGIPYQATTILKLDPSTDTVSTVGSFTNPSLGGGALAPNGMIYCVPRFGTYILKIDPSTDTLSTIGSFPSSEKWEGAVCGMNGRIYGFPSNSSSYIEINPDDDTYREIPSIESDCFSGSLAPNGKFYSPTENSSNVIEFDSRLLTTRQIQMTGPNQVNNWWGLVMGQNGWLYGAPYASNRILEVSRVGQVTSEMYTMPSDISTLSTSLYNKFYNNV